MVLIVGEKPGAPGLPGAVDDGQFKFLGYTLNDWNGIIENIKQLMALKNGAAVAPPRDGPGDFTPTPRQIAAPSTPAAPVVSRADAALKQIESSLKILVDNGGGDAKLIDILNQSNFTIKQLHDILSKALK